MFKIIMGWVQGALRQGLGSARCSIHSLAQKFSSYSPPRGLLSSGLILVGSITPQEAAIIAERSPSASRKPLDVERTCTAQLSAMWLIWAGIAMTWPGLQPSSHYSIQLSSESGIA